MPEQPISPSNLVDPAFARGAQLGDHEVVIDLTGPEPVVETRPPLVIDVRERVARRHRDGRFALVLLLALLNVADVFTTHLVLGGGGAEGNPIMSSLVADGWIGPLAVKLSVCAFIAVIVAQCPKRSSLVVTGLTVVTGIYFAIITWNLAVLLALI
jgi:hypothetical protein